MNADIATSSNCSNNKRRGRPKGSGVILTDEEKREKKRLLNANRTNRVIQHKLCEVCNKTYNANNFSRHLKSDKHIKLVTKTTQNDN